MNFTFNKPNEFKPLAIGEYEAYLEEYKFDQTQSGKNLIRLKFKIREDVEQEGQNRTISDTIWSKKDNNEEYTTFKIMNLLGATDPNLEDGKTFSSLEEALEYCVGKPVLLYVRQRNNDNNGEVENEIGKYKISNHPFNSVATTSNGNYEIVADDDLPF